MNKDDVVQTINSLVGAFEAESFELYKKVIDQTDIPDNIDLSDPEMLNLFLIAPLRDFIRNLIKDKVSCNNDVIDLYYDYDYYEEHFKEMVSTVEGGACCADKSGYLMSKLLRFFLHDEEIKHNYEQEYTYQIPEKIFRTHTEIVEFFLAVRRLRFGNNELYLKWLVKYIPTVV